MTRPQYSQALVYSGEHGKLVQMQLPIPPLEAEQALVRVTGCTLCGSDLHSLHGRRAVPTPTILGHEIVGEIVELGERFPRTDIQNKTLHLGDQVTWAIVANCGHCFYCRRGLEQKCENACKYGHMGFDSGHMLSGGLAEYCVLASGTKTIKLPAGATLELVTPASCATATVMAAMDALPNPPMEESQIAILGAGMLGLTTCAILKQRGWERITAIDPVFGKREMALRFGATRSMPPEQWIQEIERTTSPGCDAVIELSGAHSMISPALKALRIGGQLVLVGAVFPIPPISMLPEQIVRRQLTIRGVHNYRPAHLQMAIEFLSEFGKRFPFVELVTSWHGLPEVEALVRDGLSPNVVRLGVRP